MATAAAAVGAPSASAFAAVWRSPGISAFSERFLQDKSFNRAFLNRLQEWKFEDLDEDPPDGETVLSAIEEAIENTGVADRAADSETIAAALSASWTKLPTGLRQMIGAFIVGLILLIIEYCVFIPTLHPQEPAAQQKVREQRKLAIYALNQLGIKSVAYRVTAADRVPAYAHCRRDAPRTGELELGQTVEIVQKNRNWCEVIWLDANGRTRGGWVQTRYLRRL
jgi:hypothetical protein